MAELHLNSQFQVQCPLPSSTSFSQLQAGKHLGEKQYLVLAPLPAQEPSGKLRAPFFLFQLKQAGISPSTSESKPLRSDPDLHLSPFPLLSCGVLGGSSSAPGMHIPPDNSCCYSVRTGGDLRMHEAQTQHFTGVRGLRQAVLGHAASSSQAMLGHPSPALTTSHSGHSLILGS